MQCVGQWVQTALVSGLVSGLCRSYKGWQIDHESRRLSTLCHVWHEFAEDATQYDALTKIIYGGANIFNPSANRKLRSGMLSETLWNCEKTAWGLWLNHCQGQWYLTVVWGPCQAMTTTEVQCTLRPPSLRPEKKRKLSWNFNHFQQGFCQTSGSNMPCWVYWVFWVYLVLNVWELNLGSSGLALESGLPVRPTLNRCAKHVGAKVTPGPETRIAMWSAKLRYLQMASHRLKRPFGNKQNLTEVHWNYT